MSSTKSCVYFIPASLKMSWIQKYSQFFCVHFCRHPGSQASLSLMFAEIKHKIQRSICKMCEQFYSIRILITETMPCHLVN